MTSPLVDVEWLAHHRQDPRLRIVDTRWYLADPAQGRREYLDAHIPRAVFVDLDTDLSAPTGPGRHPLPDADIFAATLGARGIGSTDHVIAYDHGPGSIAARLWWMLRWVGHDRASVLDGGLAAWMAAGHETVSGAEVAAPSDFAVRTSLTQTIDRDELLARLGEVVVIDARATDRYRGDIETVDAAAGHIPTARSAPTEGNLGTDGRFRSAADLAGRFGDLGIGRTTEVVSSCGSGVTACHNALAMVIAGLAEPVLYPGSWSDWSASGLPVAVGDSPGDLPPGV